MANPPSLSTFPLAAVLAQARSLAGSSQVRSGLALSAVGAGSLGITVASGTAWVDGTYLNYAGAGSPVTPGAASATLARYDLIIIASGAVVPSIVAGTAASAPVPAALPAGALFLGYVFIGIGATDYVTPATAFIADYTMPVTLPAGTAAAPALPFTGDLTTGPLSPGTGRYQIATGGVARHETTSAGHFVPVSTSITDLGSSTLLFRDVNAVSIRASTVSTQALIASIASMNDLTVTSLHVNTASVVTLQGSFNYPRARVFNSAILAVASAAVACLTFDSERYDDSSMHSSTANTGRLVFVTSGVYILGGQVHNTAGIAGTEVALNVRIDGTTTIARHKHVIGGSTNEADWSVVGMWNATVSGGFAELMFDNRSSVPVSIFVDTQTSPEFWAVRVG